MQPDSKLLAGGLGVLGLVGAAALGYGSFVTAGETECQLQLLEARVELSDKSARLELLTEVKDSCAIALESCMEAP